MPVGPIVVINPNSCEEVTQGIRDALRPYRLPDGPEFECLTIGESPATIATVEDVARAAIRVADLAVSRPDASAFVVACFSDPGVELTRTLVRQPVIGIQEAGILTALARADLFGIVALGPVSIPRHTVKMRAMGVTGRLAGELPLSGVSALDAGTSDAVLEETLATGATLRDMGAGAIVLGCAGFAPRRRLLEERLGIAVIDPVQAAAVIALGAAMA